MPPRLPASRTRSEPGVFGRARRRALPTLACPTLARLPIARSAILAAVLASGGMTAARADDAIHLELSPRVCTLASRDTQCETQVHAEWRSPRVESLCLVIRDRPDIKRCWENYLQGAYSVDLVFADDLTFELRDPELRRVLATETLRVIREALNYRHRRRQPWSIFD